MENRELADQLPNDTGAALTPDPSPTGRGEVFAPDPFPVGRGKVFAPDPSLNGRGKVFNPALRLIQARPELFSRQGHVAATWRRRNGKTFGPYYRLGYREEGRQYSVYLGRGGELVEQVRRALEAVQMPLAQRRLFNSMERQIRAFLRADKRRVSALLRPYGLRLKGFEVRGWRYSPLRYLLPRRRFMPRIHSYRPPAPRRQTSTPAERLLRFLEARDGPPALAH